MILLNLEVAIQFEIKRHLFYWITEKHYTLYKSTPEQHRTSFLLTKLAICANLQKPY